MNKSNAAVSMTDAQLSKLKDFIANDKADLFYNWKPWKHLREIVLKLDNYECQMCKAKGKYKKAEIVHHVKHVKDRPDLALSIWDGEDRQLVSVCKACHEDEHPERMIQYQFEKKEMFNDERWD